MRKGMSKSSTGELLRACRERAGMTQQELATKLYVDRATIAKVELGIIKEPSYTLVRQWCAATNGMDLMSIDFSGSSDGWKKLRQLEDLMRTMRAGIESVNFMRKGKRHERVGPKHGRLRRWIRS